MTLFAGACLQAIRGRHKAQAKTIAGRAGSHKYPVGACLQAIRLRGTF